MNGSRVLEIMRKPVVPLASYLTMFEAAEVFLQNGISGAPVVDESGRCVGMLSAFDFVRWQRTASEADSLARGTEYHLSRRNADTSFRIEHFDKECVTAYMTQAVQSISADATLADAARIMTRAHVHRLPVLDGRGRPLGWISSLDLLAHAGSWVENGPTTN